MDTVFEIATSLSTPLALGGFLAAAFFFVAKQIIAKEIFPKLNQQFSTEIIKLIIDKLFVLSLVAMVLGFAGYVLDISNTTEARANEAVSMEPDSDIKLVDVGFIESNRDFDIIDPDENFRIDIKARNTGLNVGFIKKAVFRVERYWSLSPPFHPAMQTPTANYEVNLKLGDIPSFTEINLSQSIAPNEVDRFTFSVGIDKDHVKVNRVVPVVFSIHYLL